MGLARLVHELDHAVDVLLPVAGVAALDEMRKLLSLEAAVGVAQLESPEELVGVLEVGPGRGDFVDEVLDGQDPVLAEVLLDDGVGSQGQALAVDLCVSTLVDQVTDRGDGGLAVGDVRLYELQHLLGGPGQLDKDAVVDLDQAEELQDLAWLGRDIVDTTQTDDKGDLGLAGNVEVARGLGCTAQADLLTLAGLAVLDVVLGTLEDDLPLRSASLQGSVEDCV